MKVPAPHGGSARAKTGQAIGPQFSAVQPDREAQYTGADRFLPVPVIAFCNTVALSPPGRSLHFMTRPRRNVIAGQGAPGEMGPSG